MHRVGAIPFDIKDNDIALLFVTSQTRGRWILPKGLVGDKETHVDTCTREVFEEAGVRGTVLSDFPITVLISKQTSDGMQEVPVTYYPVLIDEQADEWPEKPKRERHWALLNDATKVTHRQDFHKLIRQFEKLSPWIKEAAAVCRSQQK